MPTHRASDIGELLAHRWQPAQLRKTGCPDAYEELPRRAALLKVPAVSSVEEYIPKHVEGPGSLRQRCMNLIVYLRKLDAALEHAVDDAADVRPDALRLEILHHRSQ